jgi:RNA polymerase sigma factor (sigma-70 family)
MGSDRTPQEAKGARVTAERAATGKMKGLPPFQRFMEEYRTSVYRFLVASVGPVEADDCFQETFIAALRAYPQLRHDDNLRGWILTIATRKAIDHGRARGRRPVPVGNVAEVGDHAGLVDPPGDERALPDSAGRLWELVRALPPRQRIAVAHRVVLDRSYPEVADLMGSTEETARANVYQGLKKLREALTSDGREAQ